MSKNRGVVIALVTSAGLIGAGLQTTAQERSQFEVASVKPTKSSDLNQGFQYRGGLLTMTNMPLRNLISQAYRVPSQRIKGGPDWVYSDRFDLVARAGDDGVPIAEANRMLQTLLGERFKLAVHTEATKVPVYALVTARPDGKLGPKIALSTHCADQQPGQPADPKCTSVYGFGRFSAMGIGMPQIGGMLTQAAGRTIQDQTGLTGRYDFELRWTPDGPNAGASTNGDAPTLFTALEEQLGLKLVPKDALLDAVVIDRAEPLIPD